MSNPIVIALPLHTETDNYELLIQFILHCSTQCLQMNNKEINQMYWLQKYSPPLFWQA